MEITVQRELCWEIIEKREMSCNKKRKEPPEVNDNGENKETDFETPSKKIRMRTEHRLFRAQKKKFELELELARNHTKTSSTSLLQFFV